MYVVNININRLIIIRIDRNKYGVNEYILNLDNNNVEYSYCIY